MHPATMSKIPAIGNPVEVPSEEVDVLPPGVAPDLGAGVVPGVVGGFVDGVVEESEGQLGTVVNAVRNAPLSPFVVSSS